MDKSMPEVIQNLKRAEPLVKERVHDKALELAAGIASMAAGRATRHPSGLWKGAGGPSYVVKDIARLNVKVSTPGGRVGKALAMSEFADGDFSGKRLGESLDAIYGAPGRILWAAYDSREVAWIDDVERIVAEVAREIEEGI
jgi:hypothetical protein